MRITGKTDVGRTRKNNEDAFFVSAGPIGIFDRLMIVADGMGGHLFGEVASGTAIETFTGSIREAADDSPEFILETAVSLANLAVLKKAEELEAPGMGTTLIAAGIIGDHVYAANVGDSRLYLINDNDNSVLQITKDHSYVEEQVEAGLMERGSEEYDAQKNVITRAIGTYSEVEPDLFDFTIQPNMYLLLCSDGLSNMVPDNVLKSLVLDTAFDLEKRADTLIERANANGGRDNITVIICEAEVNHD